MIAYNHTTPQGRALLRAVVQGVRVRQIAVGVWQASSISHPGVWHNVIDGRCDCPAALYCKHIAAVELAKECRAESQERECPHCGHTGRDVKPHVEHIGGAGYRNVYHCTNVVECWERWDRQHGLGGR